MEEMADMRCSEEEVDLGEIKLIDSVPSGSCPVGRARGDEIRLRRSSSAAMGSEGKKAEER